jgi:hypothetical protein
VCSFEDSLLVSVVFVYPLLLGIRYWKETFVAEMLEMVEVMKNQDKRAGGEQRIVWLHVSQRSDVTQPLTSCPLQLLVEKHHLTFVLPFVQFYSP